MLKSVFFRNSKEDTSKSADSPFIDIDWDSLFEGVEEKNNINILKDPKKKEKNKKSKNKRKNNSRRKHRK